MACDTTESRMLLLWLVLWLWLWLWLLLFRNEKQRAKTKKNAPHSPRSRRRPSARCRAACRYSTGSRWPHRLRRPPAPRHEMLAVFGGGSGDDDDREKQHRSTSDSTAAAAGCEEEGVGYNSEFVGWCAKRNECCGLSSVRVVRGSGGGSRSVRSFSAFL